MDIKEALSKGENIYNLNIKVTYYARVSTDNETQTTSITNQVDYFINLIKNNPNWTLVNGYIDEGISGKSTIKRENFLKMINDGLNKKFDLILTKSVSRFARNTIDSIKYTNDLLYKGVGVYFINDNINTFFSDSEFRLTLMASIAQDELRKLSESVKFGLNQSIKHGIVLGNNNILGYTKNKGKLAINKKEAQIVKEIFNLFITNNYTYISIARLINKKYNKTFDSTSIKRILTNYKYKGFYCGKKTQTIDYKSNKRKNIPKDKWIIYKDTTKIKPIVSEEIWNKANLIIENRSNKNIYKDRIICSIHNKPYINKKKKYKNKSYSYWVCSTIKTGQKCPNPTINEKDIPKILKKNKKLSMTVEKLNNKINYIIK